MQLPALFRAERDFQAILIRKHVQSLQSHQKLGTEIRLVCLVAGVVEFDVVEVILLGEETHHSVDGFPVRVD